MSRYIVTLYTPLNGGKTILPFPTARAAANAALLIYRATAEQPTAASQDTFMLKRHCTRLTWSINLATIHIEICREG